MKNVVQDLTSGGVDWQREKWQSGFGSKFIRQGEKNAVKYADEMWYLLREHSEEPDYKYLNASISCMTISESISIIMM